MIVFDLGCGAGHVFEAWFGSSDAFDSQQARGLIACPLCGDTVIAKAVMAPAIGPKANRATGREVAPHADLLLAQRDLEAQSDYVGSDFAARARALHHKPETGRGVHGEATKAEIAALHDDGIAIMPLPFMPLARSDA